MVPNSAQVGDRCRHDQLETGLASSEVACLANAKRSQSSQGVLDNEALTQFGPAYRGCLVLAGFSYETLLGMDVDRSAVG